MVEIVNLEGRIYRAVFNGILRSGKEHGGGCSDMDYVHNINWWEGDGNIRNKKTRKEYIFNFAIESKRVGFDNGTFYSKIVRFKKKVIYGPKMEAIDYDSRNPIKYQEIKGINPIIIKPKEVIDEYIKFLIGRLQKIHGMAIPGLGFHYQTYMDIESLVDRGLI